jgi:hypothetical protein
MYIDVPDSATTHTRCPPACPRFVVEAEYLIIGRRARRAAADGSDPGRGTAAEPDMPCQPTREAHMNLRFHVTIILAVLTLPAPATAQQVVQRGPDTRPRVSISPFVAYFTPFSRVEEWGFDTGDATVHTDAVTDMGGGPAAGLSVEVRVAGPLGVVGAGAWGQRGDTHVSVQQGADSFRLDGAEYLLGRLGLSLRLRQDPPDIVAHRVGAKIFGGGVVLRERPRPELGSPDFQEEATHYGASVGLGVDVPISGNRISLQVAAEDNFMFWNEAALARVPYEYFDRPGTSRDQTTVIARRSHTFLLRAGLSFHVW